MNIRALCFASAHGLDPSCNRRSAASTIHLLLPASRLTGAANTHTYLHAARTLVSLSGTATHLSTRLRARRFACFATTSCLQPAQSFFRSCLEIPYPQRDADRIPPSQHIAKKQTTWKPTCKLSQACSAHLTPDHGNRRRCVYEQPSSHTTSPLTPWRTSTASDLSRGCDIASISEGVVQVVGEI